MKMEKIVELKLEIDRIKEYVNSELCKKCEEMSGRLKTCEELFNSYLEEAREIK